MDVNKTIPKWSAPRFRCSFNPSSVPFGLSVPRPISVGWFRFTRDRFEISGTIHPRIFMSASHYLCRAVFSDFFAVSGRSSFCGSSKQMYRRIEKNCFGSNNICMRMKCKGSFNHWLWAIKYKWSNKHKVRLFEDLIWKKVSI